MEHLESLMPLSWYSQLEREFHTDYFTALKNFLKQEIKKGAQIFPATNTIFSAFESCPYEKTKVVLLGQDPYHGAGQAHGLCFSVLDGGKIPPSLRIIFKEMFSDIGQEKPASGDLSAWARQGVLLLNTTLTVRKGEAGSHQKKGWENFTDAVIQNLSKQKSGIVFLLWGKFAQTKEVLIDSSKHTILRAAHPASELYGSGRFYNCKHFSKTNEILRKQSMNEINWQLPVTSNMFQNTL